MSLAWSGDGSCWPGRTCTGTWAAASAGTDARTRGTISIGRRRERQTRRRALMGMGLRSSPVTYRMSSGCSDGLAPEAEGLFGDRGLGVLAHDPAPTLGRQPLPLAGVVVQALERA